jgi:hypothetical protein
LPAFWVLNRLPLDYVRLPVEPVQIFYLLVAYGLLSIPFFFAGLVICAAYSLLPEKTGIAYFATMTGSACGAVLPALLLPFINEGRLIVIAAVVPLLTIMPLLRPAARSPWSPSAGFRGTSGHLLAAAVVITETAALLKTPSARTYAWTANGCASVLASIAAAQMALSQGIAAIVLGGAAAYGIALICALKMRSSAGAKNSREKIEIRP